jgi:nitroreductase
VSAVVVGRDRVEDERAGARSVGSGGRVLDGPAALDALRRAMPLAALAPSAHNAQPARWTVARDGRVVLLEDEARFLAAGDPTRRDHLLSLGAAFEAMTVALSREGLALSQPLGAAECEPRATACARVIVRGARDPLLGSVEARQTHRGTFATPSPEQERRLSDLIRTRGDVTCVRGPETLRQIATLYDASLVESLTPVPVLEELGRWMRLTPAAVAAAVDGLTAPTLGLTPLAARAAGWLLRPAPFALLRALGLAKLLVTEAAVVRSATVLLVLHAPPAASRFECGRALYRLWLELTAAGMSACPMSALLDVAGGEERVAHVAQVPSSRRPVAVLRVGPAPETPPARSPRLPADRLIVRWAGDE